MSWPGFDGALYTREQWLAHVAAATIFPAARRIVEHATGIPTLAQWASFNEAAYLRNTQAYYENALHWQHGPHWFASHLHICGFSALNVRGTHASCYNADALGGEAAGNRNTEDYTSGIGKLALDNWHFAAAVMFLKLGLKPDPSTLLPHAACRADGHFQCPIENWEANHRAAETQAILDLMNAIGKLTPNDALAGQAIRLPSAGLGPAIGSMAWAQARLNAALAPQSLVVDGDNGPKTQAAVAKFQGAHHLFIDGIIGPQTIAALRFYDPSAAPGASS